MSEGQSDPHIQTRTFDRVMQFGTLEDLEALLDDGMSVEQTDFCGRTAIQLFAYRGHITGVEAMLRRKASVNHVCMYHDRIPLTALDAAMERGWTEVIGLLRQHGGKRGCEL